MQVNKISFKILALAVLLPAFLISCAKSGSLGGGTPTTSTSGTLSATVSGGLSPVSGGSATLFALVSGQAAESLATATTSSTGAVSFTFTNPGGSGLLYVQISDGNAGGGSNSNSAMSALVGTLSNVPGAITVNEMTTAALAQTMYAFGLTTSAGAFTSPANAAGAANVLTQYNNLVALGKVNTSVTSASSTQGVNLSTIANALAYCVETPGNCSNLFSTAANSSGSPATTMQGAVGNMLAVSSNTTPVYNLAFPLAPTTGFAISSAPSGSLPLSNALSITTVSSSTIPVGATPLGIAIDASGNIWVGNSTGNTLTELNSSGNTTQTIAGVTNPTNDLAIDAGNNIWTASTSGNNVLEVSAGGTVHTFAVGSSPRGVAIDPNGNIWAANFTGNTVTKLNQAGTVLGTFSVNAGGASATGPTGIAIDASGNVWVQCITTGNIVKLSGSGVNIGVTALSSAPTNAGIAVDSSGNVWATNSSSTIAKINGGSGSVMTTVSGITSGAGIAIDQSGAVWVGSTTTTIYDVNSVSGVLVGSYTGASSNPGIAIDSSGNVWATNANATGGVTRLNSVSVGPNLYPYTSQPMVPSSY